MASTSWNRVVLVSQPPKHNEPAIDAGDEPRRDYLELAKTLKARIDYADPPNRVEQLTGAWRQAVRVVRQRPRVIVSTSELAALPVQVILNLTRRKANVRHFMIGHRLTEGPKSRLQTLYPWLRDLDGIVAYSSVQIETLKCRGWIDPDKTHMVLCPVDERFYVPPAATQQIEDFILAIGMERRRYADLAEAARLLGIRTVIVAGSPWARKRGSQIPPGGLIEIRRGLSYRELLLLYQRSRVVVTNVEPSHQAAGVSSVLEALSAAKPVVISRSAGLADYYKLDPRAQTVVEARNPDALARGIEAAWQLNGRNPAGREVAERYLSLDSYLRTMAAIVGG